MKRSPKGADYSNVLKKLIEDWSALVEHPTTTAYMAHEATPEEEKMWFSCLKPELDKSMEKVKLWEAVHGDSTWDKPFV